MLNQRDEPVYSELRKASRVNLTDAVPLASPFTLFIEPTNVCNFKCLYCPESFPDYAEQAGGYHHLTRADFLHIADEIEQIGGVKLINFYILGEPFANPLLCEFIKIAKQRKLANRVIVTSNGSLLKEKIYADLLDSGLDYLRISIYAGNAEKHLERTQSKIGLDKILNNVSSFKRYRDQLQKQQPFIYIKMIDSGDALENKQFLDLFSAFADEISLEPVMNWNDPEQRNLSLMSKEDLLASAYFSHKKTVCPSPFYTLVIHSDLKVSVCCADWAKQAVIGELGKQSLAAIWQGKDMHDFRMAHLAGRRNELTACKNCTFLFTMPDNLDALSAENYQSRVNSLSTDA